MKKTGICLLIVLVSVLNSHAQRNFQLGLGMGTVNPVPRLDDYKVTTVLFSAVNASCVAFNVIGFNQSGRSKSNAGFGLVLGFLQLSYGLLHTHKDDPFRNAHVLTPVNISLGLVTIGTSAVRLFKKDPMEEKKLTFCSVF